MIVHETSDTRQSRARIWNAMLGGGEAYEDDRFVLQKLKAIAPDVSLLAVHEVEFIERAWRHIVGRRGIRQVIYCGAPIPPGAPPHAADLESIALGRLERVVYLEPDAVLSAKGAGYLADNIATVRHVDPLDLPKVDAKLKHYLVWDEPVAIVAPGVLHWLGEDAAREWLRDLSTMFPQGGYLIASHFLDPEPADPAVVVLVEQLIQRLDSTGVLAGGFFRRAAAIEALFDGWDLIGPGVVPARDWWPHGPKLLHIETPCDRLMAGVVATIPRSP
ncbi:SAM-dependent methyltransferase [Amycolatopsis plumensis]|uniref:SAM-dependent methyltransferase n=1 Tax=Amycolatopsis plumensis TaxID=236508 RepID=A0ABV5U8W5_9PSEU